MPKWKKPVNHAHPTPLLESCDHCKKTFDWRYGGAVNANKKNFCGLDCFDAYRFEMVKLTNDFDQL